MTTNGKDESLCGELTIYMKTGPDKWLGGLPTLKDGLG
jgi:hypothetical protein